MKKIYFLALALICAASVPAAKLYLGGIKLGDNPMNIYGAGELACSPQGIIEWQPGTSTLTLTDVIINWDGYNGHIPADAEASDGIAAVYYYGMDVLNIIIKGDCRFNESSGQSKKVNGGIYAYAGCNIIRGEGSGDAKLVINAPNGIVCSTDNLHKANITIDKVNVILNTSANGGFKTYVAGQGNKIAVNNDSRLEVICPADKMCVNAYYFQLSIGDDEEISTPKGAKILSFNEDGTQYTDVLWFNDDFVKGHLVIAPKGSVVETAVVTAYAAPNWTNDLHVYIWGGETTGIFPMSKSGEGKWEFITDAVGSNLIFINGDNWNGDDNQTVDINAGVKDGLCYQILCGNGSAKREVELVDCATHEPLADCPANALELVSSDEVNLLDNPAVRVYNVIGEDVTSLKNNLPQGSYILRTANQVQKITVR